jgi:hypothetical protein
MELERDGMWPVPPETQYLARYLFGLSHFLFALYVFIRRQDSFFLGLLEEIKMVNSSNPFLFEMSRLREITSKFRYVERRPVWIRQRSYALICSSATLS